MMTGREYRLIIDACLELSSVSGRHVYTILCTVINRFKLDDFDRSILQMNLYYRRHESMHDIPKYIIE